jgi:hypothetical protein
MADSLNMLIPRVERATCKSLAKALTQRGIVPEVGLDLLRAQCSEYNSRCISEIRPEEILDSPRSVLEADARVATIVRPETPLPPSSLNTLTGDFQDLSVTNRPSSTRKIGSNPIPSQTYHAQPPAVNFSSWPVRPFNGTGDVREFFMRLEEIAKSRRYPLEFLSLALPEFVTDRALVFQRTTCSENRTWSEVKASYFKRFESADTACDKRIRILTSSQGASETSGDYISRIVLINQSLESPLRSTDLLKALKRGLNSRFANALIARRPASVEELEDICLELERLTPPVAKTSVPAFRNQPRPQTNRISSASFHSSSITCFSCGRTGHIARNCYTKNRPSLPQRGRKYNGVTPTSIRNLKTDLTRPPPSFVDKSKN